MTRAEAERQLDRMLADLDLDERGERFVAWVRRGDADALTGLAEVIAAAREAGPAR